VPEVAVSNQQKNIATDFRLIDADQDEAAAICE
jgi:hypothetical protein